MTNEAKHAQEVELKRKQQEIELNKKRDKAIDQMLDAENERTARMIKNYELTTKWNRIQFRIKFIESLKIWKVFAKKRGNTTKEQD
jgi:hypothetical protein